MNTTKTVSIVFYKGPGTLAEHLIRWWTKSPYAHCEFRRSDGYCHSNDRKNFVSRLEWIEMSAEAWEEIRIDLPGEIVDRIERRQLRKNGTLYDWKGVMLSQVFRLGLHSKNRWFCSKSNADDLAYACRLMIKSRCRCYEPFICQLEEFVRTPSQEFSPASLHRVLSVSDKFRDNRV